MTDARPAAWKIAVISASALALELALIRQVPAEVRAIAYFTNLLLMASFFGLGLGCILAGKRPLHWLLPVGLLGMAAFVLRARGLVIYEEANEVHYWLQYEAWGTAPHIPLFPAAITCFVVGAVPFLAIGQALSRAMAEHERLRAYGWDIAGSLVGTLAVAVASQLDVPPWVWPAAVGFVWAGLFARGMALRAACAVAGLAFLLFAQGPHPFRWSPYYYVQHEQEKGGLRVWVNSSFHQFAVDLRPGEGNPQMQKHVLEKFSIPYDVYRQNHGGASPGKVLILGAGTGNDVNVALHNGARAVVAVEIDPVILSLGRAYNPTRPYADPRVRAVVDDARHYLRASTETFDLVVFGTLDSQTLLSGYANLRLENYVYTRESFAEVRRLLADGGMTAAYYSVFKPWLYGRLYATVRDAFGTHTRLIQTPTRFLFNAVILGAKGLPAFGDDPGNVETLADALPATDDWPYLYLERPMVAPLYLQLCGALVVLVLGAFAVLRRVQPGRGAPAHFLFLGLGFTLMESAAVVRLALLFGSTWLVNAAVFSSVLLMIFAANALVLRGHAPSLRVAWAGLCLAILANWLVPLGQLVALPAAARVAAAGLLVGVPVFFAAVCFSRLFRREAQVGPALGVNLVGAMAGGLLEYLSMVVGMRAIWLLVLGVYLLAFVSSERAARRGPVQAMQPPGS